LAEGLYKSQRRLTLTEVFIKTIIEVLFIVLEIGCWLLSNQE
jgi:hypothetical protein